MTLMVTYSLPTTTNNAGSYTNRNGISERKTESFKSVRVILSLQKLHETLNHNSSYSKIDSERILTVFFICQKLLCYLLEFLLKTPSMTNRQYLEKFQKLKH